MKLDPGKTITPSSGVIDLSHTLVRGMAQSPRHPEFHHSLVRRHGDHYRDDGSSSANDLISMGTHVGTHVDALGHFSSAGKIFGGSSALDVQLGGRLREYDAESIPVFLHPGVLLDIPAYLGTDRCEPGYEVSVDDLLGAQDNWGSEVQDGDVVLIATGWGALFQPDPEAYIGWRRGVPGIGVDAARWLAEHGVAAVGGETLALEHLPAGAGHSHLPVHELFLVQHGIYIFECMKLDELCDARCKSFDFVAAPLKIRGATGAPVRPVAVVSSDNRASA